jgi:hypothetical protein
MPTPSRLTEIAVDKAITDKATFEERIAEEARDSKRRLQRSLRAAQLGNCSCAEPASQRPNHERHMTARGSSQREPDRCLFDFPRFDLNKVDRVSTLVGDF